MDFSKLMNTEFEIYAFHIVLKIILAYTLVILLCFYCVFYGQCEVWIQYTKLNNTSIKLYCFVKFGQDECIHFTLRATKTSISQFSVFWVCSLN